MVPFTKFAAPLMLTASLALGATVSAADEGQKPTGDVHVGQGVVCDTAQQVERFTALIGEAQDIEQAVNTVNTEAENPRACGVVLAAFTRGDELGELRNGERSVTVVEITILAVPVGDKWHFVAPLKQYAAFPNKGVEV
jgi:hypothetical protein